MLMRPLPVALLVVAAGTLTPRAQEPSAPADPALAAIRARLREVENARSADRHDDARRTVREALTACLELPDLASRKDAHDLLYEVGLVAYFAAERRTAHDAWQRVCDYRARTLPDDHAELQRVRQNLAATKQALGDLHGARALFEKVYEVRVRTLPDDAADLQRARSNLAAIQRDLGDVRGAGALFEKVHDVFQRTLADDHADLQLARANLAATKAALGDLPGALALEEKVYEVRRRALPDDHADLQAARLNLAVTKRALGDLAGAHALFEKAHEIWSRMLPDQHEDLQWARTNLAVTKRDLGDLAGARALRESVYDVCSRTLPDDHPDLQRARTNLANVKRVLGDVAGARALLEKAHEVRSRTLPNDHPELQRTRLALVLVLLDAGDPSGARALAEKVHEQLVRALPDDHPDLQLARGNLAATRLDLGELAGARALLDKVYEVRRSVLPDDHPDLQATRGSLALVCALAGDADRAVALARERCGAGRRRLSGWELSPREFGAMAAQESEGLGLLLTLAGGFAALGAKPELAAEALAIAQTLRGMQTGSARALRRARTADAERAVALENELRAAATEISRVAGERLGGNGGELDARRADRAARLTAAVEAKERVERALTALAAKAGHVATVVAGAQELAAALPERSAAAAIVGFEHMAADPDRPGRTINGPRLAALVLWRSGAVLLRDLGPRSEIEALVTALRTQIGAGHDRGHPPLAGDDPLARQKALRKLVLDPILAVAGDLDTLWLSVDETLELVPLDALAREDGTPLGSELALRPLTSLLELLEPTADVGASPALLAIGGIDYDEAGEAGLAVLGRAPAPPGADTRSGRPDSFRVLPSSATEVSAIVAYFAKTFAAERVQSWTGRAANKSALLAAAPDATFVHLATHGYFAPETVASTADAASAGEGAITGLSPLVLCGLALSGANLPPDDLGRHAGILTAEEILSLDLSRCFLVTLSACDTSLGVRRAGQGYASLRAALQGAGARFVLTSLWKVGDEQTMELMVDFYRRLWVQKKDPHAALWEAKMEARKKGAPFRDWAGWVLTGR